MVLSTGRRGARLLPWVRLVALVPISLLVGHQAVFAAQYGLGNDLAVAMQAGGHDGYWQAFSVVILGLTLALLAREAVHAVRLHLRTHGTDRPGAARAARGRARLLEADPSWWAEFRVLWPLLFALTVAAFTGLENAEHLAAGLAPHGLGSLVGSEHPAAVPVLTLVTAVIAAVGALIRWRARMLELRARAVAPAAPRRHPERIAPSREWPLPGSLRAHSWFLARLLAGRAPPRVA